MRFLSRLDDFENIIIDGSVSTSGLSSVYIKDATTPILRIGSNTGDSFITYDGTELSVSSDVDLRLTTPTDQDVFLITSSGNIVTTQGGGNFTIGGGLTLGNFGAGYLKTDTNGVVSIDTDIIEDTLDSVTDRGATTTNAITVGGLTVDTDTLYVDATNDRVGIGTTAPNLKLHISHNDSNNGLLLQNSNNVNNYQILLNIRENEGLIFQRWISGVFNTNLATLDYNGNVGIGTTAPTTKLYVDGGESTFNRGNSDGAIARFRGKNAEQAVIGTVDSWFDSNVGIRTTNPGAALDVKSHAHIDNYAAGTTSQHTAGYLRLISSSKTGWGPGDELGKIEFYSVDASGIGVRNAASIRAINSQGNGTSTTTFNGELAFYTSAYNATESEAVRINSAGNVGIGLTGPTEKLHVSGNILATGTITASNFSGSSSGTNTGDQTTITGNAGSATVLQTARTLTIGSTGKSFDGSANVAWTLGEIGAAAAVHNHTTLTGVTSIGFAAQASDSASITTTISSTSTFFDFNLTDDNNNDEWRWRFTPSGASVYSAMRLVPVTNTTANLVVSGTIAASNFSGSSSGTNTGDQTTITGNAGSATVLQTARTINGTSFDGSANITTSNWGTSRTVTIGNTGKSVNGSANVSWSLAEIGAQPAGSYLTAEADTLATVTGRGASTTDAITVRGITSTKDSAQLIINRVDTTGATWSFYSWADGLNIFPNAAKTIYIGRDGSNTDLELYNGNLRVLGTGTSYFAGSVGIGNTNPSVALDVTGEIAIRGGESADDARMYFRASDNSNRFTIETDLDGTTNNDLLGFRSASTDNILVLKGNGNVGIGTTAPGAKLALGHIANQNGVLNYTLAVTGESSLFQSYADISVSGFPRVLDIVAGSGDTGGTAAGSIIRFLTSSGAGAAATSEKVRITAAGNVGIGTTTANTLLSIDGVADNGISIQGIGTTATRAFFGLDASGDGYMSLTNGSTFVKNVQLTSDLGVNNYILGNVGIGTTAPAVKLQVGDSGDTSNYVRVRTSTADVYVGANPSSTHIGINNGGKILQTLAYPLAIGTTQNQELYLGANNATIATLVDGKFGIGTTTPATKLHVVGTAETRLRVGSSNAASNVVLELRDENTPTGQGTVITYNNATGETYFNNALSTATTDFHFQSGEYGTASDFFALSDAGGNSIVQLSTATGDAFITYEDAINELAIASDGDLRLTTPTDQDVFYISSGGNIDMTQAGGVVDMGGNLVVDGQVGIGVSPAEKLHVNGNILSKDATGNYREIRVVSQGSAALYGGNESSPWDLYFGDDLWFEKNSSILATIKASNGNFGVNTTNPLQKLHVSGGHMVIENTYGLYLNGSDTNWQFGRNIVTDSGFLTSNTVQIKVFNGANQGFQIVNSSNTAVFEVEGSGGRARVLGGLAVGNITPSATAGRIDASNDIVAYSSSDERLKENIKPIENALDKVKSLTGVEFDWKPEHKEAHGYEGHDTGVIAQQVQDVMPSAVRENETGFLAVRYEKLIGLLIEGMKEQQVQIDELKAKLDGLTK